MSTPAIWVKDRMIVPKGTPGAELAVLASDGNAVVGRRSDGPLSAADGRRLRILVIAYMLHCATGPLWPEDLVGLLHWQQGEEWSQSTINSDLRFLRMVGYAKREQGQWVKAGTPSELACLFR